MPPLLLLPCLVAALPSAPGADGSFSRAPIRLSIEAAIAQAVETDEAISIASAGVGRADADVRRAWSEWLPQISASITYDRTLQTEYEGLFASPDTGSLFNELPFGQPNTWRAGLAFSQNLFAGGRSWARLVAADEANRAAILSRVSARAQAVLAVVQTYYDALLARRGYEIEEENVRQAERTLEQARVAQANDTKAAFDVLRAEVSLGNLRPRLLQRRGEVARSERALRQALELPNEVPLVLTSSLEESLLDPVAAAVATAGIADETTRISVLQARSSVAVREASLTIAAAQRLPQLDASMSYGFSAYPDKFVPGFDDMRENWIVGLALRVPIFSGMRVTADVDAAQADAQEARARLRQAEELAALDSDNARSELETALATYEASSGVVEQAEASARIAVLRYDEGISTQLELADAQLMLAQARANRAQAARDLRVARVRFALLPALPVSPASGSANPAIAATLTAAPAATSTSAGAFTPGLTGTGGAPIVGAPALIPGASSMSGGSSAPGVPRAP